MFGNNCIWIIILLLCCGNGSNDGCNDGCGASTFGGNNCLWLIILLCCCGGNNGGFFGSNDCGNNCGC